MSDDLKARFDFAVDAATASSRLTLDYFGQRSLLDETAKADGSPVTAADRACESDLRARIQERFADDAILGEEFERKAGSSDFEWVIDPIDGTISFVQGVPLYGTMLACMRNGVPEIGVIAMPALDETVYAALGHGAWFRQGAYQPVPARVSPVDRLDQAIVNTTSMSYFVTPEHRRLYERLDAGAKHTRGWSDCYAWVLLATGRVDAVIEPVLSLWDFAAAIPIVTEAGGAWSDFAGVRNVETGEIVAANATLLTQIQDEIRSNAEGVMPASGVGEDGDL